jgi:hypothetical protein
MSNARARTGPDDSRAVARPSRQMTRTRVLEIVLAVYAAVAFALLWIGLGVGLATGGALFADTWTWLSGLEPLAAVVVWILALPIAIALWAWNADLPTLVAAVVAVGLVAWTLTAITGIVRTFRRS